MRPQTAQAFGHGSSVISYQCRKISIQRFEYISFLFFVPEAQTGRQHQCPHAWHEKGREQAVSERAKCVPQGTKCVPYKNRGLPCGGSPRAERFLQPSSIQSRAVSRAGVSGSRTGRWQHPYLQHSLALKNAAVPAPHTGQPSQGPSWV